MFMYTSTNLLKREGPHCMVLVFIVVGGKIFNFRAKLLSMHDKKYGYIVFSSFKFR
jgi:hypothetical protein